MTAFEMNGLRRILRVSWTANKTRVGVSGLVVRVSESQLSGRVFESHCGPFASNLEQVANLRRAQVNSASYPS